MAKVGTHAMSGSLISFTISGNPKPLKRHRSTRSGRMYDPSSKDKQDMWLQIAKHRPELPFKGCIYLKAQFYMPRPKSHYKTKAGKPTDIIKEKYKTINLHSFKPDLDNLLKMICDTIQGKDRMIYDDSQICWVSAIKTYGSPRTEITIEEI